MVKLEDIDQLKCEITAIPTRHYNHAARALAIAEKLLKERNNVIALAKKVLIENSHLSEKEALARIFSHLHRGDGLNQTAPYKPY